jgi:hypothetical protein
VRFPRRTRCGTPPPPGFSKGRGDIYVLSKILGHSSVAVTEKVYAHLLSEDLLLRSRGVSRGLQQPQPATVLPLKREA